MNLKRFLLAFVAVAIVGTVYDILVHGRILGSTYAAFPALWRTPEQTTLLTLTNVFWALFLTLLYAQYGKARPWGLANGLWFGLLTGFLGGWLPVVYNKLLLADFPGPVYVGWSVGNLGGFLVCGLVLGRLYKE